MADRPDMKLRELFGNQIWQLQWGKWEFELASTPEYLLPLGHLETPFYWIVNTWTGN